VTDRAPVYPRMLDELVPAARHVSEQYVNNAIEADHGRLKAWLRLMRGLKRVASARITADLPVHDRVRTAFDELALAL
jgi:IS6 family transposase